MRRAALIALILVAALTASGAAAPTTPRSGLYGVVKKGPVRPVCTVDEPCDVPVKITLVFSRTGRVPVRARSQASGRYRTALAPGIYSVRSVERIGLAKFPFPHRVKVRRGHWDKIDFFFDTGIR